MFRRIKEDFNLRKRIAVDTDEIINAEKAGWDYWLEPIDEDTINALCGITE